jgi:hypothetical protein
VYDTTLGKIFTWSGTTFQNVTPTPPQVGQFRDGVAHTDAEPANLVSGDWVIFTSSGTLTNFVPGEVVQIADLAFYNGTTWILVQGNVVQATETVVGVVRLATNAEAIGGSESQAVMTPATTAALIANTIVLSDLYHQETISLTANTPLTITTAFGFPQNVQFYDTSVAGKRIPVELAWYYDTTIFKVVVESNIDLPNVLMRVLKFITA